MSDNQNQAKPIIAATAAPIFQLFKSFHFILLAAVLLATLGAVVWFYEQANQKATVSSAQQSQAIVVLTQDSLAVQALSQKLTTLVFDIKQAVQSLDRQQAAFLDSQRFFLMNSVFQEASYAQALVIKSFQVMEQLDKALMLANQHAQQYQAQSTAVAAHYDHIQSLQLSANTLGRAFYKLSWKFDELTTSITKTLQHARYDGFAQGVDHYTSVGSQKTAAMDSSIFWAGSKLTDMKAVMGESMSSVENIIATPNTALGVQSLSARHQQSVATVMLGVMAMAVIWFYGVLKPRAALAKSAQALGRNNTEQLDVLTMPKGQWGAIAYSLEQVARSQHELELRDAVKTDQIEQLRLSLLKNVYDQDALSVTTESSADDALLANMLIKQEVLPGFDQKAYHLN